MSGNQLVAYKNGVPQALFTFHDSENATLEYANTETKSLSLSLKNGSKHNPKKVMRWLMNLLPTNDEVIAALKREYGVRTHLELVKQLGHDLPGAYSLLPPDVNQASLQAVQRVAVSDREIYSAIIAIRKGQLENPLPFGTHLSISGFQRKFVLSRYNNLWFRASYMLPSTHLLKPANPQFNDDTIVEYSTQLLAKHLGIDSAETQIFSVADQTALASTRFDRSNGLRLHMEDLNQVLGNTPGRNYATPQWRVLFELLHENRIDVWPLVQQIIYNVTVGNSDAHLKNYSILETTTGLRVSPLYDSMALLGFKELTTKLALGIGTATYIKEMSIPIWKKWAVKSGLNPEQVAEYVLWVKRAVATDGVELFRQNGVPVHHITAMLEASSNIN